MRLVPVPVVFAIALTVATSGLTGCSRSSLEGSTKVEIIRDRPAAAADSPASADEPTPGCVDLNTATVDQLTTLPGIGVGLAGRIIEYRQQHGPFRRPQDMIIINGFGERRYHKLEPFICNH
jgi:competence ComEA-like helix-hairpin-helix protein